MTYNSKWENRYFLHFYMFKRKQIEKNYSDNMNKKTI